MRKRPDNDGTVYFHASKKRWVAALKINGRRVERTARTERLATAILRDLHRQREAAEPVPMDRQTVAQFLESWRQDRRLQGGAISTFSRQGSLIRHNTGKIADIPLAKVTAQDLQALYSDRLAAGQARSTVALLHRVLHAAFKQAVELGAIPTNPAARVRGPRIPRGRKITLKANEARAFLAAARGDRYEALYVLALTTGMRQGEMLGLRWRSVDLDTATVQVVESMSYVDRAVVWSDSKNDRSRRQISLSAIAVAALRSHRARQAEERLRADAWEDNDLVFCSPAGKPLRKDAIVRQSFNRLLKAAGVPLITFHQLRHTCATLLLEKGIHPKVVSDMLGHSSIAMTLDLYSHVIKSMHDIAASAMDDLFQLPEGPVNGRVNGGAGPT